MKKVVSSLIGMSLLFSASSVFAESSASTSLPPQLKFRDALQGTTKATYKANEVIVKLKSNDRTASILGLKKQYASFGLEHAATLDPIGIELIKFKTGTPIETVLKALNNSANVEYAELNYIRQKTAVNDPYFPYQWGLKNVGQDIGDVGVAGMDIKAEAAWTKTKGSSSVVVAVIDSGVDITHPDLKNRILKNAKEVANDKIDNDKNGFVDDVYGWDFAGDDNSVYDDPEVDFHGTHVSGIIAGNADKNGIIGVAPGVKVLPIKGINEEGMSIADEITAIQYAKLRGAKIINASFGGPGYSKAEYDAIKNSGALFIAAAGNVGINNDGKNPDYPASYNLPNILSVAAVDNKGKRASWSSYGAKSVDVGAPGVNILSTIPVKTPGTSISYDFASGTSMAAPMTTGVAALLLSANPSATTSSIKDTIMKTAKPLPSLKGKTVTGGMVDAGAALGILSAGTYEQNVIGIVYSGKWKSNSSSSVSGGSYVKVNEAKTKATFTFIGKGFAWKGLKDKKQGIAKVTVDGKKSYEVNLYSASTLYKKDLLKVTGLSSGKHVVTIEWTGKAAKGASKNATEINLDSIVIY